jgi:N-dimethylarginine dimethylaminohydrolase
MVKAETVGTEILNKVAVNPMEKQDAYSVAAPETATSGKWLMCPPTFFDVTYEINPWMSTQVVPEGEKAEQQWKGLYDAMIAGGAQVEIIQPIQGLPDMVFTANGGLVFGNKVIIPTFRHPERQGESAYFEKWFDDRGYETYKPTAHFEGAGDALFAGDVLVIGTGPRSNKEALTPVREFLGNPDVIMCTLIDFRFYHLDTCFCPLTPGDVAIFPDAFSSDSLRSLENRFNLIIVSEEDARKFACNAVVLGEKVLHPTCSPAFTKQLKEVSKEGVGLELTEFLKAGGSAKCLCLQLS